MRAYLLGVLDGHRASELEEKYFHDPESLRRLRKIEDSLIEEYLNGGLSGIDRQRFESRYLAVPELRRRLDQIRAERPVVGPRARWLRPGYAFALAALVLIAATGEYYAYTRSAETGARLAGPVIASRLVAIDILLTPGVAKGAAKTVEFSSPASNTRIRLRLQLPGQTAPRDYMARILAVDAGDRAALWTSQTLRSVPAGPDGEVVVEFDSSTLPPNDYIAQVIRPDGGVLESYIFRVTPADR